MGVSFGGRGARGCGATLVAVLCLLLALSAAPAARAESIGAGTLEQFTEVTTWAFSNSPVELTAPCGEVCGRLSSAEADAMPNQPAAREIQEELAEFAIGHKLWSPLSELASQIGTRGIGEGHYTIGWLMGGAEKKWMTLQEPGAGNAPELRWCGSMGNYTFKLLGPGETYGYEGHLTAPSWLYVAGQEYCPFGGSATTRSSARRGATRRSPLRRPGRNGRATKR
jgi:hypothetical protein